MSETNYKPTGALQGDDRAIPHRGSMTGMNGDTYGADLAGGSTNRQGSLTGATKSDAIDMEPGCNNKEGC